jgi:glutathione reductase (NADPH)
MHKAIKGSFFLLATGERPVNNIEDYKGLEHCISTDDFFKVLIRPKKVLILGGGYIALEIASILSGFGVESCLYHRSNLVKSKQFLNML